MNDPLLPINTRIIVAYNLPGDIRGYGFVDNTVKYIVELTKGHYVSDTDIFTRYLVVDPANCELMP